MAHNSERASEAEWQELTPVENLPAPAASDEDWLMLATAGAGRVSPQSGFEDLGVELPAALRATAPASFGLAEQASGAAAAGALPLQDAAPANERVDVLSVTASPDHVAEQLSCSRRSSTGSLFFSVPPSPWSPVNVPVVGDGLRAACSRRRSALGTSSGGTSASALAGAAAVVTGPRAQQLAQQRKEEMQDGTGNETEEDGEFVTPFAFGADQDHESLQAVSALSFGSALDSSESLVVLSPSATPTMPVRFTPGSSEVVSIADSAEVTPVASTLQPLSPRQLRSISEADDTAHAELSPDFQAVSRSFAAFGPLVECPGEAGEATEGPEIAVATEPEGFAAVAAASDVTGASENARSALSRVPVGHSHSSSLPHAAALAPTRRHTGTGPLRSAFSPAVLPPPTLLDEFMHSSLRMLLQSHHVFTRIGQRILAAFRRLARFLTRSRRSGSAVAASSTPTVSTTAAPGKAKAATKGKGKRPAGQGV